MNSSSPICHSRRSLPPMSSSCICIAGPYAPQLSDEDNEQDPDRWCSHSAWGQECWQWVSQWVWNLRAVRWAISFILIRYARLNLPQLSHLLHRAPLPPRAMRLLMWACPGKRAASRARTFLSSLMERCVVPPTSNFLHMNTVEKLMGACASCMGPASAVVVPVRCVSSVNGMGEQRQSRAR